MGVCLELPCEEGEGQCHWDGHCIGYDVKCLPGVCDPSYKLSKHAKCCYRIKVEGEKCIEGTIHKLQS